MVFDDLLIFCQKAMESNFRGAGHKDIGVYSLSSTHFDLVKQIKTE